MAWTRRRRWLVAAMVGWAVLLVAAAYVSARGGEPTAPEQTSVADARPAVHRAVAGLVDAGVTAGAVVSVSPFTRLGGCRISAVRDGERWEQAVNLFIQPGQESALLDRVAAGLPGSWRASVRLRGGRRTLRADAGDFVAVSGGSATPGEIRITVATGCRTPAGVEPAAEGEPPAERRAPLDPVLAALRLTGAALGVGQRRRNPRRVRAAGGRRHRSR